MTATNVITRALDIQQRTMDAMFDILSQADLIAIECSMGKTSDKRAMADLIDLFNSPDFHALEMNLMKSAAAATIARGFEPLVTGSTPKKTRKKT